MAGILGKVIKGTFEELPISKTSDDMGIPNDDYIQQTIKNKGKEEAEIQLRAELKRKRELLQMREEAHGRLEGYIESHPKGRQAGLDAILSNDSYAQAANSNIEYKQKALQGYAEKFIPEAKQELSTTHLGLRKNEELGDAVARAIIDGDKTNPRAVKLGEEITKSLTFLKDRFNKFGGEIGTLKKSGYLPQTHDSVTIRRTPKQEWIDFTYPRLDDETKLKIDNGQLDLDYIYDTISTGGLNKNVGKAGHKGGKATVNKHAEQRQLDFKDGDSWLEYQKKFGASDIMATIDDHIRTMTTDMAAIEVLGPNPEAMFKSLKDDILAKDTLEGVKNPGHGLGQSEKMWNVVSGKVDQDKGEFAGAGFLQTTRAMNTASLLTSAAISTITDPLLAAVNAGFHGMNPVKTLGSYVSNFVKSASKKSFEEQQLMGLGADVFSSEVTRRFSELGEGFWAKASEAVMRASFMNTLTESARQAFKVQFMKKLLNGRKLDELSVDEHIKLLEQVAEEADYAVVMGNARSRAITTMGESKGTAVGEISRSSLQFMTFPLTFMIMQGSRIARQGTIGSKIGYGAAMFTVLTVGGSLAMMGKDAAKGYTPRKGSNPFGEDDSKDKIKFWGASAMQGGGLGIFGDFLFSDSNRFGGSKGITALGPTAGLIGDAWKTGYGNLQKAFDPEDPETHFGTDLVDFTNRHMNPLKIHYVAAAWEQYIIRNVKIMIDEDYERTERKKLRKRSKEYGQEKFEWLQN